MDLRLAARFLAQSRRIARHDRWSRAAVEAHQARELARVRAAAVAASPFYRGHHRGLADAPLTALPTLSKPVLMERFDDVVTDRRVHLADVRRYMDSHAHGGLFLDTYRISTTGGTTGEAVVILLDGPAWGRYLAGAARSRAFAGIGFSPLRRLRSAAVVGTQPWQTTAKMMRSFQSRFAPMLHLNAADPIPRIDQALNRWQPDMLVGYTSVLGVLADEQLHGRLRIHPRAVMTGGELLTDDIRQRITDAWGQPPFDDYACVEGGNLAAECREGRRLHLLDDEALIEVVDADNRPVPAGTWGDRVLVTPFWNAVQPLVRYEVDDVLRLSPDPCPCGRPFPVVDGIRGRSFEVLRFPARDGGHVSILPISLGAVVLVVPAAWWKITQEGDRLVFLFQGVRGSFDVESIRTSAGRILDEAGAVVAGIDVRVLAEIPRTAAGKVAPTP